MKKFTTILCMTAMALTLTACGGSKETDITVDTAKLADELLTTVTSDTLSETPADMIPSIYFIDADAMENSAAYASSGTTACEVAVIQSKSKDSTADVEKQFKNRVESQSSLYASYNQGEVEKLDKAVIKSAGTYTVLCVCDDVDKANDILKNYGF